MVNIIIYLRVVSNFDAVQKPKIGISNALFFHTPMGKIFVTATTSIEKKDSIWSKTVNIFKHFVRNKF